MLRLVSDENLRGAIIRGLRRRAPDLDLVRVQEVGLRQADDPTVLEWAASERRILLTHDRKTIPRFAYDRVDLGQFMPGVFVVSNQLSVGQAIEEILMVAESNSEEEWRDWVTYLPL